MVLINESMVVGGSPAHRAGSTDVLRELLSDAERREQFRELLGGLRQMRNEQLERRR